LFGSLDAPRIDAPPAAARNPSGDSNMQTASLPSESNDRPTRVHRALVSALFGAAVTVVTLTGAVTIADTPRQLATITQSLGSTELFELVPATYDEPPTQALTPASGYYEDSGLQVTYEVYA
jgi:hypothetical protein